MFTGSDAQCPVYSAPRPGADFALYPLQPTVALRTAVIENMTALDWNRYYKIPEQLLRKAVFQTEKDAHHLVLTRGAEAGMLALAVSQRPARIWVPEHSYPGYMRVASAIQAELKEYRTLSEALNAGHSKNEIQDWIVITYPGNPIDCLISKNKWRGASEFGFQLIVDAVYSMPGTTEFTSIVEAAMGAGGIVLFSFSKCIPLPGIRLGGIITEELSQLPPVAYHHASVLDAAVLLALTDLSVVQSLDQQRLEVAHVHREIKHELLRLGLPILGSKSGIFITTVDDPILTEIRGKRYPSGLLRAHTTKRNLESLRMLEVSR